MQRSTAIPAAQPQVATELWAYLGLTLASFGWASAFIAGKVTLKELPPLPTAAIRYIVSALVLLPLAWSAWPSRAALRMVRTPLLLMIACGGMLYQWLFLLALERTSATNAALLVALNPVFTMLLSPLAGERFERGRLGGVLLALGGAALVITRGQLTHLGGMAAGDLHSGDLLAVAAALCWACFNVASRRVVHVMSAAATNAVVYGFGGIVLGAIAASQHPWQQIAHASAAAWTGLLVMALFSSVAAGQLFLIGVRSIGVGRTVVFVYFVPVLTAIASVLWLGETFGWGQAVGGGAVLAGVYGTTRRR